MREYLCVYVCAYTCAHARAWLDVIMCTWMNARGEVSGTLVPAHMYTYNPCSQPCTCLPLFYSHTPNKSKKTTCQWQLGFLAIIYRYMLSLHCLRKALAWDKRQLLKPLRWGFCQKAETKLELLRPRDYKKRQKQDALGLNSNCASERQIENFQDIHCNAGPIWTRLTIFYNTTLKKSIYSRHFSTRLHMDLPWLLCVYLFGFCNCSVSYVLETES